MKLPTEWNVVMDMNGQKMTVYFADEDKARAFFELTKQDKGWDEITAELGLVWGENFQGVIDHVN